MANKKIVVGQSSITAGQMKDFWRKVGDDTIGFENFRDFLENPHKFIPKTTSLLTACNILGWDKVIDANQVREAWGQLLSDKSPAIRYDRLALEECAKQNKKSGTDFRLVYLQGLSLRELREKIGSNEKSQPFFNKVDWWLNSEQDSWTNQKPEAGYYLIDFNGRFACTSWGHQDIKITKLLNYDRAKEASITEAIVNIFKITGERLLEDWWHWGSALTMDRDSVSVGHFDNNGLKVYKYNPYQDYDNLCVCLLRKFTTK